VVGARIISGSCSVCGFGGGGTGGVVGPRRIAGSSSACATAEKPHITKILSIQPRYTEIGRSIYMAANLLFAGARLL